MKYKNVLLTGASRGIGRALAYELADHGYNLLLLSRNEELLKNIQADLANKTKVIIRKCDVTNYEDIKSSIELCLSNFGSIDVAILNAGIGFNEAVNNINFNDFSNVINTNFLSIVKFTELLVPVMKKQNQGIIAGVSSLADGRGYPFSASYNASKAASSIFLESARIELKKDNIDVLTIKPGFVRTDMTDKNKFYMPFLMSPERSAKYIRKGIEKKKRIISYPLGTVLLTRLGNNIPDFIFEKFISKTKK